MSASDSRYPEGLNSLPAEAKVDPVFTGTGIFVVDFLSHGERGQKEGDYVKRKKG
jgi:hypothetical protein